MSRNVVPLRTIEALSRYLREYPEEITFGDQPPEDVLDRYHAEDYVMVNDGIELDRQRLLDHVRPARKRAQAVSVDVHDVVVDGDRVAARYELVAEMRKGGRIVTEIHMFGRLAPDGRLQQVDQLTRTIT
jgi:hypothetical protein